MQGIGLALLVRATPGGSPHTAESRLSYLAGSPWLTIPGEAGKIRSVRMGSWKFIRIPRNVEVARRLDPSLESGRRYEMSRILDERLQSTLAPAGPWRQL